MGGYGSGYYFPVDSKVILDECLTLDINQLVKKRAITSYTQRSGSLEWGNSVVGEVVQSISFESNTRVLTGAYFRVFYKLGFDKTMDYKIRLSCTKPHYGGIRFWFLCPFTGHRVTKLFLLQSEKTFASRHACKGCYASQLKGEIEREIDKKWRLVRGTSGTSYPIRPKGMHHKTFDKLLRAFWKQEVICEELLLGDLRPSFYQ